MPDGAERRPENRCQTFSIMLRCFMQGVRFKQNQALYRLMVGIDTRLATKNIIVSNKAEMKSQAN